MAVFTHQFLPFKFSCASYVRIALKSITYDKNVFNNKTAQFAIYLFLPLTLRFICKYHEESIGIIHMTAVIAFSPHFMLELTIVNCTETTFII